jgi:hypothetical protein
MINAASLLTTLFAFAVGFFIHKKYLKGQQLWVIIAGTLAFGEVFKWVTGIETFPLQIFKKTQVGAELDQKTQDAVGGSSIQLLRSSQNS